MNEEQRALRAAEETWVGVMCQRFLEDAEKDEENILVEDLVELIGLELDLEPDNEFGLTKEEIEAICKETHNAYFTDPIDRMVEW